MYSTAAANQDTEDDMYEEDSEVVPKINELIESLFNDTGKTKEEECFMCRIGNLDSVTEKCSAASSCTNRNSVNLVMLFDKSY